MATSLYDLSVPTYLQTVSAVGGFLDRAAKHCAEMGFDPDRFISERLFVDMAPFNFHVEVIPHHSVSALEAARTGVFDPPGLVWPKSFAELQAMIAQAEAVVKAFTPDEVNSWEGKALDLQIGPRRLAFGRDLHPLLLPAQRPFPRLNGSRHPADEWRADQQAGLRGAAARWLPSVAPLPGAQSGERG